MINQKINTPLGEGIEQGQYALTDGTGALVTLHKLVRIVLSDETAKHKQDANCLTPRASRSALFHFPAGESGEAVPEYALMLGLILLVLLFGGYLLGWPW